MIIEWIFLALFVSLAGLIWCLPFLMWFIHSYDTKTDQLKEKNTWRRTHEPTQSETATPHNV